MKNKITKRERHDGPFKELLGDLISSILFEIVLNILLFIPKMIIRSIKNIW